MVQDEVIQKLLNDLKEKVKEIEEIYNTLQTLKKYGAPIELPELQNLMGTYEGLKIDNGQATSISIRPDEFYGMSNTEATEKYLRKVGYAASFDDIFEALVRGGISFQGDGRKNLNNQLTRATRKFAKIGRGNAVSFGMLEWYPSRARKKESGLEKIANEMGLSEEEGEEIKIEEEGLQKSEEETDIPKSEGGDIKQGALPQQEETAIRRGRPRKLIES